MTGYQSVRSLEYMLCSVTIKIKLQARIIYFRVYKIYCAIRACSALFCCSSFHIHHNPCLYFVGFVAFSFFVFFKQFSFCFVRFFIWKLFNRVEGKFHFNCVFVAMLTKATWPFHTIFLLHVAGARFKIVKTRFVLFWNWNLIFCSFYFLFSFASVGPAALGLIKIFLFCLFVLMFVDLIRSVRVNLMNLFYVSRWEFFFHREKKIVMVTFKFWLCFQHTILLTIV